MAERFDKFTERARQVLTLANEVARSYKHNYIGTEHILVALVRVEEGLGAKALVNLGISAEAIEKAIERIVSRSETAPGAGEIGLTPRAKKVIELAVDEARRLGHHYIGTEHVLLGLIREGEGIAAGVLKSLDITFDATRGEVQRLLSQPAPGRFTERAQQALTLAEDEARALRHDYIGQEHLLLALVQVEEGLAAKVLAKLGMTPERMREAVAAKIGPGGAPPDAVLKRTERLERAIELAIDSGRRLNHNYAGTEHLLLGVLEEREGVGSNILLSLGVQLDEVRAEILATLAVPSGEHQGIRRILAEVFERDKGLKRYNLVLPEDLYQQVQALAERDNTTVVEVLRRFIKLGLLATRVTEAPDSALIIREGGREREILLL
jgi:ATP-dependent Clp protease ATP-binding subunit ClpA